MATAIPTQVAVAKGVIKTTWVLAGSDDGRPETAPQFPRKSVQVTGTFGGGSVQIEGSNDGGVTYFTLTDGQGNVLTFTAAGGEKIQENTERIRPRALGVITATVSLVCEEDA